MNPIEKLMTLIKSQNTKKGKKLCDLTAEEQAEMVQILSRGHALESEKEHLDLVEREIFLDKDKWWEKVKKNHKSVLDGFANISHEDGAIYERVDKKD